MERSAWGDRRFVCGFLGWGEREIGVLGSFVLWVLF